MYYYSVDYKTIPSVLPQYLQAEIGLASEYEMSFLFKHQNKLDEEGISNAFESNLKDNKINYTELVIIKSKEITEQGFTDRTQYT